MAIVKMKKFRLFAVRSEREDILRALQGLGCVELSEPDRLLGDEQAGALLGRDAGEAAKYRARYNDLGNAIQLLNRYAPQKSKLLSPKPGISGDSVMDEAGLDAVYDAAKQIILTDERIKRLIAEESQSRSLIVSLLPWADMTLPLDFQGTKETVAVTGAVPADTDLDAVETSVYEASQETEFIRVSSGPEQHCVLVICMRGEQNEVTDALRLYGFSAAGTGGLSGTARENIEAAEINLLDFAAERGKLTEEIAGYAQIREELKLAFDRMNVIVERNDAAEKLAVTESSFVLEGWAVGETIPAIEEALSRFDCAWEFYEPTEDEIGDGEVPVKLKNNKLTGTLNMVTEMYSLPAYGGVDPNPLMAPFFILFYGIMLADIAYGLILLIAGIVVTRKAKPGGTMGHMFGLMIPCGISTIFWGLLTGGFLGDFIPQILKIINPESTFTWFYEPLFTPLEDTIMILIGSMILGFIQLITGTAISFIGKVKAGKGKDGFWDEVTLWLLFAGVVLAVLGIGNINGIPVTLIAAGLLFLIGASREARGIGKFTAAIGAVYNTVTGYFGDILSYSRLMALMLAGSVIAQVFNTLGAIPGNVVVFVLISLVGNTLNFVLNVLGCFVHDLRLQCLEYFGKFYEDGGRPFRPLDINTKYVNIVKE